MNILYKLHNHILRIAFKKTPSKSSRRNTAVASITEISILSHASRNTWKPFYKRLLQRRNMETIPNILCIFQMNNPGN